MRSYVVAAWDLKRQRDRDLQEVDAETAEHAIHRVVAKRPLATRSVYEAWPSREPENNLRMVFAQRGD